jgi:threonine-phosphate decarboxylase
MDESSENNRAIHGGRVYVAARKWGVPVSEVVDFSANVNPFGPPEALAKVNEEAWRNIASYPDESEFVGALAHKLRAPERCIVVSNGSASLLFDVVRALKPSGALIVEPSFSEYRRVLEACRVHIDTYYLSEQRKFLPDFYALRSLIRGGEIDLVILNSPHNPSGALCPGSELLSIAREAHELGAFLLIDEAFIDYAPGGSNAIELMNLPNTIVLRSLTKFYAMPGLRIGYALCRPELAGQIARQIPTWPISSVALWAATKAIGDAAFEERSRSLNTTAREEFENALVESGLTVFPAAANFLLIKLPAGSGADLERWLEPHRILIRRCDSFRGLDDRFVRLAVRSSKDNLRLAELLGRWLRTSP